MATQPLVTRRRAALFESEVTHGTDPTPLPSANVIVVESPTPNFPPELIDPEPAKPSLSRVAPIQGRFHMTMNFSVRMKGSGAAGTPPEFGPLLVACGMTETIVASTSVTYTPAANPNDMATAPSGTLYWYQDGIRWRMSAVRGNVTFQFPVGNNPMAVFELMGLPVKDDDQTLPALTNLDATLSPIVVNAGFTIGGYAGVINALECNMQNVVELSDDVNATGGYGGVNIVDRNVQGSMNPEATLIATKDWWAAWQAATQQALTLTVGATAGNIITFSGPKVVQRELTPGDRNGLFIYDIPISYAEDAGDDEVSLVFT